MGKALLFIMEYLLDMNGIFGSITGSDLQLAEMI